MINVLRFHSTTYTVPGRGEFRSSWWQLGDRIFRHRMQALG